MAGAVVWLDGRSTSIHPVAANQALGIGMLVAGGVIHLSMYPTMALWPRWSSDRRAYLSPLVFTNRGRGQLRRNLLTMLTGDDDANDPKPDDVAGDYPLNHFIQGPDVVNRGVIGRGGHATVYKAEQPLIGKLVALKVLHQYLRHEPELGKRIIDEARTLARLEHPNIVQVLNAGYTRDDRNLPWIMLELLDGSNGRLLLERKRRLPIENTLDIFIPLAKGLALAHEHGIIHQDLKPENIFIHRSRTGAITKLCDFGIQRSISATHSAANEGENRGHVAVCGAGAASGRATFHQRRRLRLRCYALRVPHRGATLSQMGGGGSARSRSGRRKPWTVRGFVTTGEAVQRSWIVNAKLSNDAAPKLQLHGRFPPPLEDLVAECLERLPSRRPKSMLEVGQRLTEVSSNIGAVIP